MKWNSESRIKSIIHAEGYIPQQQYFKVFINRQLFNKNINFKFFFIFQIRFPTIKIIGKQKLK